MLEDPLDDRAERKSVMKLFLPDNENVGWPGNQSRISSQIILRVMKASSVFLHSSLALLIVNN